MCPLSATVAFLCGGKPPKGRDRAQGRQERSRAADATTCLTDQPVTLQKVPQIDDVKLMETILNELGVVSTGTSAVKASPTVTCNPSRIPKTQSLMSLVPASAVP